MTAAAKKILKRTQTIAEEIANSITHGLGALLSLGVLIFFIAISGSIVNPWNRASLIIFGASMLILYTASMLYHMVREDKLKKALRVVDHASIYLLIAGTYSPFSLIFLPDSWGKPLFLSVWIMAALGITFKIFFTGKLRRMSVVFYLIMGWVAIIAINPIIKNFPRDLIFWLIAGGAFYTLGIIFYGWKKMPFHHSVWHLFVLGGSASHLIGILRHIKLA